jgi:hypothetical protein
MGVGKNEAMATGGALLPEFAISGVAAGVGVLRSTLGVGLFGARTGVGETEDRTSGGVLLGLELVEELGLEALGCSASAEIRMLPA